MVETGATSRSFPGWDAVPEDIIPDVDDTYDLGSSTKQWAALWVVLAMVTSLTIGGVIGLSNIDSVLFINASTHINGSLLVDVNISAINITASGYYFGNGSQLSGVLTSFTELDPFWLANWTNVAFTNIDETFDEKLTITKNLTISDDLIMDQDDYINLGAGIQYYNGTCVIIEGSAATLEIC